MNTVNHIPKGRVIFGADEPFTAIGLLLKGRVLVEADGIKTVFSSGNFLGACDIHSDTHSFTYTAYDNASIYVFMVQSKNDFENVLKKSAEYYGLLNTSFNFFIAEMHRTYQSLENQCKNIREYICTEYDAYLKAGKESGIATEYIKAIDAIKEEEEEDFVPDKHIPYYVACSGLAVSAQKEYYMGSPFVSMYHFSEQRRCVFSLLKMLSDRSKEMLRYFRIMVSDEKNLFSVIAGLAMNLGYMGKDNRHQTDVVDELIQKINDIETFLTDKVGQNVYVNRKKIEKIYLSLMTGEPSEEVEISTEEDLSDLKNSLEQILSYTVIDKEVKEDFTNKLNEFKSLSDKFGKDEKASKLRKKLAAHFYVIYEKVFLKSIEDNNPPLVIKLFLTYGYVCETLLKEEQLKELLSLRPKDNYKDGSRVYTMPEWLTAIYQMKKLPSKNEFDQDFEQYIRQEQLDGRRTKEELNDLQSNPVERIRYEIRNVFRYANRVLFGRTTMFVPILCSEGLTNELSNSYLTADQINTQIAAIEAIDFSIFYREKVVFYQEAGITKEIVMKRYCPDIIIFPIYGQNGLMWQDIVGKKRTTKGRILFPIFLESNLEKELLKVLGLFRWEICRSEQGMHWNDIQYPSLTSEYTDYLQFYRKNSGLSPETKEKVKSQLSQSGNRHRNVFSKDYTDWILRESNGGIRLNKVARTILATYCPFRKDIRDRTNEQPINVEAGRRFIQEREKRLRQLTGSCSKFDKAGIPIPEEIERTREYLTKT
ncbi:MAG: cyclic nucleotide-binding domain-containing protein [Lachnoclostridium sp.]|nr:cyclic nucleotide-binding domain-containing protein [Lachnoclostridium sp.]